MDIDSSTSTLEVIQTPPIQIASPARQPVPNMDDDNDIIPIPKLDHAAIAAKAKKRKKNKKNKMQPGAPAVNIIKGFQTPVTSGGEESDYSAVSTPRLGALSGKDIPSITGSPYLRPSPSQGGLSALKARLDALSLDNDERKPSLARVVSSSSVNYDSAATPSSRGSDGDKTEMETYDVPLGEEFVSPDAGARTPLFASHAVEGGLRSTSIHRKMCANDFEAWAKAHMALYILSNNTPQAVSTPRSR